PVLGSRRMVGGAACMDTVRALAQRAATSDVSVLILGESGTGKELLAESIHLNGPLAKRPFIRVDCASLSDTLLESELFGHVKGAFTGATTTRQGRFEIADGGTILLDEIGDITPQLQKKLLRFLQSREFERVGDNQTRRVNVRVLSATHRDLRQTVEDETFREDLYWRLSAFPIELPPLRDRVDDIVLLAEHFLKLHWVNEGPVPTLSPRVRRLLLTHGWRGNCRELENVMWYAATLTRGDEVLPEHLPPQFAMDSPPSKEGTNTRTILAALELHKWNRSKAAEALGISRVTLWRRMQKLGISPE
ncbi:MAG: sigma-54-dependent Fis family transcriptional regulator, partial [Deltaproteobacteria bacterium]|nr:sigma-54-dependent Fis family transcriptional regulator [Deltaproteobacteria bacterium]